jgi:hypothetical protein
MQPISRRNHDVLRSAGVRRAGLRRGDNARSEAKIAVSKLDFAFFVAIGVYGCVELNARRGVARDAQVRGVAHGEQEECC